MAKVVGHEVDRSGLVVRTHGGPQEVGDVPESIAVGTGMVRAVAQREHLVYAHVVDLLAGGRLLDGVEQRDRLPIGGGDDQIVAIEYVLEDGPGCPNGSGMKSHLRVSQGFGLVSDPIGNPIRSWAISRGRSTNAR